MFQTNEQINCIYNLIFWHIVFEGFWEVTDQNIYKYGGEWCELNHWLILCLWNPSCNKLCIRLLKNVLHQFCLECGGNGGVCIWENSQIIQFLFSRAQLNGSVFRLVRSCLQRQPQVFVLSVYVSPQILPHPPSVLSWGPNHPLLVRGVDRRRGMPPGLEIVW